MQVRNGRKNGWLYGMTLFFVMVLATGCNPFDELDDEINDVDHSVNGLEKKVDNIEKTVDTDGPIRYETAEQLEKLVEERRKAYGIPGMILAIRKSGQTTWATASGVSNLATDTELRTDDTFRMGSCSKTFTAIATLRVMESRNRDGNPATDVSLDDPVADHLPDLATLLNDYEDTHGFDRSKIHIRHLLNHTSGLLNFTENPVWGNDFLNNREKQFTPEELVDLADVPDYPPSFQPGAGMAYSNTNYVLLGLLIEEWTGNSFEDVVTTDLITPNGLYGTLVPKTGAPSMEAASPNGFWSEGYYDLDGDGVIASDEAVSGQDPSFTWSSGNMTATADDMLNWVLHVGRGDLLTTLRSQQKTFVPFTGYTELMYGLGLVKDLRDLNNPDDDLLGHQGGSMGYQSVMLYLPHEDAAVVCLINRTLPPTVKNYASICVYDALAIVFPDRRAAAQ